MSFDELVLNNQRLIYKVIKDLNCYWNTEDEFQDLYDAGLEGLINGAKKYDGSTKPSTYLYKCIKNQILRHIYLSECDVRKINKETISLNDIAYDNEHNQVEVIDLVADESTDVEYEIEGKIQMEAIMKAINNLEIEKDKLAIKMYYGLEGYIPMSYERVGKELGVTREMARVRITRAVKNIKKAIKEEEKKVIVNKQKQKKIKNNDVEYLNKTLDDALGELLKICYKKKNIKKKIIMTKSELADFTIKVVELVKSIYVEV